MPGTGGFIEPKITTRQGGVNMPSDMMLAAQSPETTNPMRE
jgi:hypothetical protein